MSDTALALPGDFGAALTSTFGDGPIPRRAPTLAGFFVLGLFWGAWAAVLPSVQHATATSKGALGVAMLFASVGSIPVMFLFAPRAIDRFGARAVAVGCAGLAGAVLLPGLATSLPSLILALCVCGMAAGLVDVAINANVGRIETATGRRLQPFAHCTYSVGVVVGAVGAGFARSAGTGREPILITVSICIAVAALVISSGSYMHAPPSAASDRGSSEGRWPWGDSSGRLPVASRIVLSSAAAHCSRRQAARLRRSPRTHRLASSASRSAVPASR